MKIGIDGRAAKLYRGTGIGTYTYQLIQCLNKIDIQNEYFLFMPDNLNYDMPLKSNFSLKSMPENIQPTFWDTVNIPNILKDNEINLYHVPQNGVGLPKDKHCPFVITLHDVIPYKMPETVGDRYLEIFLKEMPEIITLCDGIITVSNYSKKDIIEAFHFPEEKIHVTYLASEEIYKVLNNSECRSFIKNNYGIDGDYILYVGGFSPRKNIVGLIEAFSKLISVYKKDIKLVIVGKQGKSYEIYKKRTLDLHVEDTVLFPGFIPIEHLPIFYNAAALFVYPSFYEGFGLPPIEAMACGTPVITSNVTSIPEIVGDASILVAPQNVDALFYAMYQVLEDEALRLNLIANGFKKASSLKWEDTAKNTLIAYENIVKRGITVY